MDTKELYPGYGEDVRLARVVPAPRQIAHQELEYFGFIHFTVNTFTGREWGNGEESPAIFNPEKLDAGRIRRFVESEAFARICAADEVLRELDFITALPAAEVLTAQGTAPADSAAVAQAKVLVQGIADLVLVFPDHLELLDYKTDRRKSEADFLAAYRAQLDLYALAISKRFAPKPVTYKGIYSLELGKLIEVK